MRKRSLARPLRPESLYRVVGPDWRTATPYELLPVATVAIVSNVLGSIARNAYRSGRAPVAAAI
jgi:hypothetical protein